MRVGVVGCGTISGAYFKNMKASPHVKVVACADQIKERATAGATEYGISKVLSPEALVADRDVDLVLNLTIPNAHADVTLAALANGKHVYTEKPFAITREDGQRILEIARSKGLIVASAPDTFLGSGIQTCLRVIEQGEIGQPLAASGFMLGRGPENWHPNPAFFYQPGGGPLLDVGPYYVTTMVCLLGPVHRVTGMSRVLYSERKADRGPRAGETFKVTTPTFIAALLEFEGGAQATLVTSFGIYGADLPNMQVYCSKGILGVPDPNYFWGPVKLRSDEEESKWQEVPLAFHHTDGPGNFRGLGVIEMALAIDRGDAPRASGELGYHVLDVMLSILESASSGRHVEVQSTCKRPAPLSADSDLVVAS